MTYAATGFPPHASADAASDAGLHAGPYAGTARWMAEAHERMRSAAAALATADNNVFPERLAAFVASVESDFQTEEAVMESIDYPGLPAHREEHARLLAALHRIDAMVDGGDFAGGRQALALLPHWCCMHEMGMDGPLMRALGAGAPDLPHWGQYSA